jgi:hypothetical protein
MLAGRAWFVCTLTHTQNAEIVMFANAQTAAIHRLRLRVALMDGLHPGLLLSPDFPGATP